MFARSLDLGLLLLGHELLATAANVRVVEEVAEEHQVRDFHSETQPVRVRGDVTRCALQVQQTHMEQHQVRDDELRDLQHCDTLRNRRGNLDMQRPQEVVAEENRDESTKLHAIWYC